jgi:hypothetical protein
MATRTIGGWALLINAVLTLVILIAITTSVGGDSVLGIVGLALGPLLIMGLVAIWAMQPHSGRLGQLGLVGVWLLGIATGIAFLVRLAVLIGSVNVGDFIPLSSALFGLVGSLFLGWATVRAAAFHPAFGWLLIIGGVLNLVGGVVPGGTVALLVAAAATLAQVGALGGYGWTMLRGGAYAQGASIAKR